MYTFLSAIIEDWHSETETETKYERHMIRNNIQNTTHGKGKR